MDYLTFKTNTIVITKQLTRSDQVFQLAHLVIEQSECFLTSFKFCCNKLEFLFFFCNYCLKLLHLILFILKVAKLLILPAQSMISGACFHEPLVYTSCRDSSLFLDSSPLSELDPHKLMATIFLYVATVFDFTDIQTTYVAKYPERPCISILLPETNVPKKIT